jgi:hypothetical protein
MKTHLAAALIALSTAVAPSMAQQNSSEDQGPTIVIKRIRSADGTETIETTIKKGVTSGKERLRRDLTDKDSVRIEVAEISLGKVYEQLEGVDWEEIGEELKENLQRLNLHLERLLDSIPVYRHPRHRISPPRVYGYLGVTPRDGDDPDKQGVPVDVLPYTAAERAGLENGDVLMSLDGEPLHSWEELESRIRRTKPGQQVNIQYQRDKRLNTIAVELGSQRMREIAGYPLLRQKEACLGVYSTAHSKEGISGARITSFTERSAARQARLQEGDVITAIDTTRVSDSDRLWEAIARHRPGDRVTVHFYRDGRPQQVEVTLEACRSSSAAEPLITQPERSPITLHRPKEGDMPPAEPLPEVTEGRQLALSEFRAFPNPTTGLITVTFRAQPAPLTVSLFDLAGRRLFHQELNVFGGYYNQQFDLSDLGKGTLLLTVQQGERRFIERIVLH